MPKIRVLVFLSTLIVVGAMGLFVSYYARGYRLDFKTLKFQPNGILVIQSEPTGASVYIDGELKTATNTTLSLSPGNYDVEVRRDGYFTWYKRLSIQKEIVTQANVSLFKIAPSLSPVTLDGAQNPVESLDGSKIAYTDKNGLWIMDTFTLPLGFSNDPKRITDGDLSTATYQFSPDARQILLTVGTSMFLIDSGSFTPQAQMTNIASQKETILTRWAAEKKAKDASAIRNLPPDLADILNRKSQDFIFSPDDQMVLYTASASGTLPDNLVRPLPGASTQKQERNVNPGSTYVYDIKEDRNFLIDDQPIDTATTSLRWMPTSRHLLLAQPNQIAVMDYDGTNRQVVYSGIYASPFAFPYSNTTRLLILTNLGSEAGSPNLYTLTVK